MKKYVSLDKCSKKAKKEYYAGFRRTWDGVNPVTRTMPNGKAYNRKKDKEKLRKIDCVSEMDIPSIFVFMNDCGADSDNKQVMGIKTISLYDFI